MSTSPRRSGARTRSASALLAALALAGGLSACGDDDGATATDLAGTTSTPSPSDAEIPSETPSPSDSPSEPSADPGATPIDAEGSAGVTEAVLVDATEGGGSPSTLAFALDTDQAVSDFVVGLQNGLPDEVAAAVHEVHAPGSTPYGAVVSTGCEPPRSVAIDAGEAGFEVVPALPKSTVQCLAPVTYVVVFAAPDA
ncbi:hypothetical protein NYO98_11460 [Nocardioides sp. STR2]|uniref:CHRD domain-containing protein n=1 Tax=Nocardioides pini TaxID=2975053 RepID=A0ABT4CD51_9ACTN|nr:hypothetical protein [Nocardioides pini]MCY4726895.1 hypothetical protein [Nocardioides pini]